MTDEDIKNQLWNKYLSLKGQSAPKRAFLQLYGEAKCSLFTLMSMWGLYHFYLQNQIEHYFEYEENALTISPYVAIPAIIGCATVYASLSPSFRPSSVEKPEYFVKDALNDEEIALWNQHCRKFASLCETYDKPVSIDKYLLSRETDLNNAMLNATLFINTKKAHPVIINMLASNWILPRQ